MFFSPYAQPESTTLIQLYFHQEKQQAKQQFLREINVEHKIQPHCASIVPFHTLKKL